MTFELFGRTFATKPGQQREIFWTDDPEKVAIFEQFCRELYEGDDAT